MAHCCDAGVTHLAANVLDAEAGCGDGVGLVILKGGATTRTLFRDKEGGGLPQGPPDGDLLRSHEPIGLMTCMRGRKAVASVLSPCHHTFGRAMVRSRVNAREHAYGTSCRPQCHSKCHESIAPAIIPLSGVLAYQRAQFTRKSPRSDHRSLTSTFMVVAVVSPSGTKACALPTPWSTSKGPEVVAN